MAPARRRNGATSPAVCIGAEKTRVQGNPDWDHISTSYVERRNLAMRRSMRRFTRLTNAFSEKLENHAAAVSLYCKYYNFARPHQSLCEKYGPKRTPAMAARLATYVWSVEDIVKLLDSRE